MTNETKKPHTVVLYESVIGSVISDAVTFSITAGLVLLADGRSTAWQIITIGMFVFWSASKTLLGGKVKKFYSKREISEWVQQLPEEK
jgi:hypothetical protein